MGEFKTLIDGKKFTYEGLISVQGLYRAARNWLDEHGYGPYEKEHTEQVFEDGKQIQIDMRGDKKISDYAQIDWRTTFTFEKCTEVTVEKDGHNVKMNRGKVIIKSDVYLKTDWDKSFEQNAFQYFLRVVIDKFFFKSYVSRAQSKAKKDYAIYEELLKSFLNMEQFR